MPAQQGVMSAYQLMAHNHSGIGQGGLISHLVLNDVPFVDVREYGIVGTDLLDERALFQTCIDDTPEGGVIIIPDNFLIQVGAEIAFTKTLSIIGMGSWTGIHNVGVGNALTIGEAGTNTFGVVLKNLQIFGGAGTGDSLHLNRVQHSYFENIIVAGCHGTSFYLHGSLLNSFTRCSANLSPKIPGSVVAAPTHGVVLDILDAINSNANTLIILMHME